MATGLDILQGRQVNPIGATMSTGMDRTTAFRTRPTDTSLLAPAAAPVDITAGDHGATDLLAKVSREQFEQYKKFGYPIENQMIGMIGVPQTSLADATGMASSIGAVQSSEANRSLAGYGLTQTADQAATNSRLNSMNTVATMAGARNAVRQGSKDLDQQILIGAPNDGLPNV